MSSVRRRRPPPDHHTPENHSRSDSPPPFTLPPIPPPIRNTATNAETPFPERGIDNYNQYNNNTQMERVTFHLHSRVCHFGLDYTTYRFRKVVEHLLLVVAICCAGALVMLHRTFVIHNAPTASAHMHWSANSNGIVPARTCLDLLKGFDPAAADITHLVILPQNLTLVDNPGGEDVDNTSDNGNVNLASALGTKSRVLWNRKRRTHCNFDNKNKNNKMDSKPSECAATKGSNESFGHTLNALGVDAADNNDDETTLAYEQWLDQQLASKTLDVRYSYSTTKAYLMLPRDHPWLWKDDMMLDVQYVLVAPDDPECFGEPFVQFLLWRSFVGGNTVLLNWIRTFPSYQRQPHDSVVSGYVFNPRTQWLRELDATTVEGTRAASEGDDDNEDPGGETFQSCSRRLARWNRSFWIKAGVFLRTSFLFFFCTTLVSFTLRETQERMLEFTQELSRRVRQSISLSDLITTHLAQNLVFVPIMLGMMFFLIEFYNGDKFLAFGISSIVWCVEGFSMVCLRSSQGLSYFPYFFFLLFLLFHVYQTAFPDHGFVYVALTVVWCFILHSMFFFWHRYELPALVLGAVTIDRPRMNVNMENIGGTINMSNTGNHHQDATSSTGVVSSAGSVSSSQHSLSRRFEGRNDDSALEQQDANGSIDRNPQSVPFAATGRSGNGTSATFLPSNQSFLSTASSRRTYGLYQHNQEDDGSTGSHLYFMGGEVVVHRPNSNSARNNSNPTTIQNVNSDLSLPPPTRSWAITEGGGPRNVVLSRNESNFSLLSSTSDAYGSGGFNGNGGDQEDEDHLSSAPVAAAAATDHHDSFGSLPNDTSLETIPVSNLSTPQKHPRSNGSTHDAGTDRINHAASTATVSSEDYAHESGGLQAIFESKLTPRVRNTERERASQCVLGMAGQPKLPEQQQQQQQQHQNSPTNGTQYQRRPPTFPELTRSKK